MNTKNAIMTTTLSIVAVLAIASVTGINNVFAEENTGYKTADDIHTLVTFMFKDGVETHEFPVFNMDDDFVANSGSQSFSLEGVVGDAPYLHKALDEAYYHRYSSASEYNYQFFDVDVNFVKNDKTIKTLNYRNCYVDDYQVDTLNDSYESYLSSSSGFAIIDNIDLTCGGLNALVKTETSEWKTTYSNTEYPKTPFKFAGDVRTFITFEFENGIEKIEFPSFTLNGGFEESTNNVVPGFSVEGSLQDHPLLNTAIDNARGVSGNAYASNVDFVATVEFANDSGVLRTLKFQDCRVTSGEINTQSDKEEGFTGKSGFAYVENIGFECIGISTKNPSFDQLKEGIPVWSTTKIVNNVPSHEFPLGTGPRAVATFTYKDGIETIDFPLFDQSNVLGFVDTAGNNKGNTFTQISKTPVFVLTGLVGDFPMLYHRVDENLKLTSSTGASNFLELFDVDVDLVYGDKIVRGFNYSDCRVIDYVVQTQQNKEESYFKGFALSNTFELECLGYHPNNPVYDAMFIKEKAKTTTTNDLRNTDQWGPGFYVE